jgi:hypothetical protein
MVLSFPECAQNVSPGAVALLVGLTTGNCYFEGACRECNNTLVESLVAAHPDEFVRLSVADASKAKTIRSGNITDTLGSREFYCDGSLGSVSLGADSWLIGTPSCTVDYLTVTGTGARVEGVDVVSYGPLEGVGLELRDLAGATAVIAPRKGAYSVRCNGLSVFNSRVAVGGCRDTWSANGELAVAIYQASSAPTGTPGTIISIDAITDVFGRPYEARFFEGITDIGSKKDIFETSLIFLATSLVALFGSWWLTT